VSTNRTTSLRLECDWQTDEAFVSLFAVADDHGSFAEIYVDDPSAGSFGFNVATLTTSAFETTMDLFARDGEGELGPIGSASAVATLSPGGRISDSYEFDDTRVDVKGDRLLVAGQLDLITPAGSLSLAMDDASCRGADLRVTEHPVGTDRGPRVRNDTPDRAGVLAVGASATVDTSGTSAAAEVPCTVVDGETGDVYDVPFGRTAWWTFQGTGTPLTVDTAGSDFDTVLGIYVVEGGDFVQLSCVDDVVDGAFTVEARTIVPTDAGATYFVQAGGFGGSVGQLTVGITEP
jgi:hypothetical protein